jgi:hypothetical protein
MRQRLRPTPALALADWLRVYLGLSGATDEMREDFPRHDNIARLISLGPSDLKRQLSSVLSAILSEEWPQPREIQGAVIAANIILSHTTSRRALERRRPPDMELSSAHD